MTASPQEGQTMEPKRGNRALQAQLVIAIKEVQGAQRETIDTTMPDKLQIIKTLMDIEAQLRDIMESVPEDKPERG